MVVEAGVTLGRAEGVAPAVVAEVVAALEVKAIVGLMLEVVKVEEDGSVEVPVRALLLREVVVTEVALCVAVGGLAVSGHPPSGLHGSTAQHPAKLLPTRLQEYHWKPDGQFLDCRI